MVNKEEKLTAQLKKYGSVVIAFSGGVDSSYLAFTAFRCLGEKSYAVTALSSTYPERQQYEAENIARQIGIEHHFIVSEELDIPEFRNNPPDRCFYCKYELFSKIKNIADEKGFNTVIDGSNVDDLGDFRPGRKAAEKLNVKSPLVETGFTKDDIRHYSKIHNLPTWNKPAFACLASRFPYGSEINKEKLHQIDMGEQFLLDCGFKQFRARHEGDTVRIELLPEDIDKATSGDVREKIVTKFKNLGFKFVSLDLEGYRTGSMNERLTCNELEYKYD